MDLSSEDALRLNVLLANQPQAIRIDESSMTLYGLSEKGEARVALNPNCRDDLYLRKVRELLSGHVLGSPGGYPIYLKRWSRMGQTRDESLEQLLLLGEPEAVAAVTGARGLSDELARRAWWIVRVLVTFHLVCFGWLLFRSGSLAEVARNLALLAGPLEAGFAASWLLPFAVLVAPLLLVQLAQARSSDLEAPLGWSLPARVATYTVLFFIFVTLGEDGGQPFVYFQF